MLDSWFAFDGNTYLHEKRLDKNWTIFTGGITAGYQHYFDARQNHGIKTQVSFQSGYSNLDFSSVLVEPTPDGLYASKNSSVIPIKIGIEISYLWDFFNRGEHTLGLDIGVGYDVGVWLWSSKDTSFARYFFRDFPKIAHTIAPKIGLHYYYGNHQFNLAYEFGGVIKGLEAKKVVVFTKDTWAPGVDSVGGQNITSNPSYFSFGYSYRF